MDARRLRFFGLGGVGVVAAWVSLGGCTSATSVLDGFGASDGGELGDATSAGDTESAPARDAGSLATEDARAAIDPGNGAGPDASTSADSGARRDAAAADAAKAADAAATPDTGAATVLGDAGLCDDASDWLVPMNQARATVGESPLGCDPIAAEVALNYANMCVWAHNMNRNTDYTALGGKGGVGENIAAGSPTETIAAAVNSWNSEVQFYDHTTNTCASGQQCGHYTQIVWKTTTAVGCAKVHCTTANAALGGATSWDFSVCDYSPPGNVVGESPY